jgi:nicotinamide-nucleotide amidase
VSSKGELIAVGSELLRGSHRDTNGDWLSEQLEALGFSLGVRSAVEDDPERIAALARRALDRAPFVLVVGGLGPTEDDRTREGLALALDLPLERDPEQLRRLESWFRRRARPFLPEQARQAERPRGAEWIDNPLGTAPGIALELGKSELFALPGVPAEMRAMFSSFVAPRIAARGNRSLARRILRVAGRTELSVDRQLSDLYGLPGVAVTVLSGHEGIEIHLLVEGFRAEDADDRVAEADRLISERLGRDLYGRGEETLAQVVGSLLSRGDRTLATAESCTAGLLAGAVTEVAGSSRWFRGGLVVYSDDLKRELAGVDARTLQRHGAVSEQVAGQLASGARERCGADLGIGITGVAGPGGGTSEKPVGLVHLALADRYEIRHGRMLFAGNREMIRRRTVAAALDLVRRHLLEFAEKGEEQ